MSEESESVEISDRFADQPERTPRQIEQMVLAVTPASPLERLSAALDVADWLAGRSRAIHMASRKIGIAWIEANGEFDIGSHHYSVGYSKSTKCIDVAKCGLALLDAVEGDFDRFLTFLGSDAIRYGAARSVLNPLTFAKLFETKVASRLIDGAPGRVLLRSNSAYSPRNRKL